MSGKDRYRRTKSSQISRKESKVLVFSGTLGITTNAENQVEVPGRPGFVWVQLRNQLNETIQAYNESVAPVFSLPVLVEYDKDNPIRYKVRGRDIGRYTVWVTTNAAGDTVPSTSSYLPAHGASHSFNKLTGVGGGDVVWVYSDQFMPWAVTPSGSAGYLSVSIQPSAYYYDNQFRWAGGTGIAGLDVLRPTGSSNARMILVYLDPDTGNPYLATGTLIEFANTITGTQQIMPYMPSLIEETDIPLAGVRIITGTSKILWQNLYDLRDYFAHSSTSGSSGGGGAPTDAQYVVMALDGTLSDERVLTAGADVTLTDGGAGGNATVGVATGTFSRAGHGHLYPYSVPIYEDDVFVATGTIIDFGTNVNVSATGSVVYVSTVDTTGGGGGDLLIYDDSVFSVTGTAISFDENLIVHVTGSVAYIESTATGTAGPPGDNTLLIYDDSVFSVTGTAISFDTNLDVSVTGSIAYIEGLLGPDWVVNEDHSSECNGSTTVFTTDNTFTAGSTIVSLNGLIQRPGASYDYLESGTVAVSFNTAPLSDDHLLVSYIKSGTGAASTSISNLYISAPDGSDITGDGSSGNPYQTLNKALSILPDHLYSDVTIYCATGTYSEAIDIERFRCNPNTTLKITGDTTTPANVSFTDVTASNYGCYIEGPINVEIEGIRINVTGNGVLVQKNATLTIDRCTITGTLTNGVVVLYYSTLWLNGNITISGWSAYGMSFQHHSFCRYSSAGTLTVTGPGTSGTGIHLYMHSQMRIASVSGLNITITGVQFGFQLGLNAAFQHITATATITIDNASKPGSSAGVQCTDLSTWSTSQAMVIDNFTDAYEANSISYIEASGSRTITNVDNTSDATQNSVIYLP